MAITVENVQTATYSSGTGVTITKPTGLAVGDLMVAHVTYLSESGTVAVPSGWTAVSDTRNMSAGGSGGSQRALWKIAASGDVAASDFSFTHDAGSVATGGALFRISGHHPTSPVDKQQHDQQASNDQTPTFTYNLDPTYTSSLLMFLFLSTTDTNSSSNYAVSVSNPSWTEQYDFTSSSNIQMAGATALRAEDTATGDWTCNCGSAGTVDSTMQAIVIKPFISVTVTPDAVAGTSTVNAPTVIGGASVTVSTVTGTSTVNTPTAGQATWSAQAKSTAVTWTANSKS